MGKPYSAKIISFNHECEIAVQGWLSDGDPSLEDQQHIRSILDAHGQGRAYAVLANEAFAGAVTIRNVDYEYARLNLIWLHPDFRGCKIGPEAMRQALLCLFKHYESVGIWQPNERVRKILVQLGMHSKYDQPRDEICFDRNELSLDKPLI